MMGPLGFWISVMAYCTVLQADVTYYFRTPETEAVQVPPIAHSPHEVWMAADVKYRNPRPAPERIEWGRRLGIRVIGEADHDHLQPLEWEAG